VNATIVDSSQLFALAHVDLACYSIAQFSLFERAPHHEKLISKLEAVERGEIKRLIILLLPRHGKSLITSSIFPAWYLGRNPQHHVIFATYGQEFSDDFGGTPSARHQSDRKGLVWRLGRARTL